MPDPRSVLTSTAITRRAPGAGAVRCRAQAPAASSRASASRFGKVGRNVDWHGTTPVTPSSSGFWVRVGSPFRDRGERAGAGQHRTYRQAQDHCQPVTHPAARPRVRDGGSRARPLPRACAAVSNWPIAGSGMMAQRAWSLGSDRAGAGTAMITSEAVPAPLPAHIGVSQSARSLPARTLPAPWPGWRRVRWAG